MCVGSGSLSLVLQPFAPPLRSGPEGIRTPDLQLSRNARLTLVAPIRLSEMVLIAS